MPTNRRISNKQQRRDDHLSSKCPEKAAAPLKRGHPKADKPNEPLFREQRMCAAGTRFTTTAAALAYLSNVCAVHRGLSLSLERFTPENVTTRVLNRDVIWLANFVAVWLDEHLLTSSVRRRLSPCPGTMCCTLESLLVSMDYCRSVNVTFDVIIKELYRVVILEGSFNALTDLAKELKRMYNESELGHISGALMIRYRMVYEWLFETLTSMQHHGVIRQLTAQGLMRDGDGNVLTPPEFCLRSSIAKQLVNAIVHLFSSKKETTHNALEKAKTLLRRLPGDVVRRFVIPDIPMFRADIYSVLYYNLRVITTEAYLDVLLACRTRRNTISSMHCAFHDRQRRFQVAPY
eukprot:PhM_4_TR15956/c0_g2_i4/m.102880